MYKIGKDASNLIRWKCVVFISYIKIGQILYILGIYNKKIMRLTRQMCKTNVLSTQL